MRHEHKLGTCAHCGRDVVSVRDAKDHTVGDIAHGGLHGYKSKDRL